MIPSKQMQMLGTATITNLFICDNLRNLVSEANGWLKLPFIFLCELRVLCGEIFSFVFFVP